MVLESNEKGALHDAGKGENEMLVTNWEEIIDECTLFKSGDTQLCARDDYQIRKIDCNVEISVYLSLDNNMDDVSLYFVF